MRLGRWPAAGSRQLAAESDAEVARLVRRRLPLDQPARPRAGAGRITVRVADARAVLQQVRVASFDVLVADAFAGARTPAHLTSVEFTAAAARALAPAGIYAANIGDGPPLAHARGRVAAVRAEVPRREPRGASQGAQRARPTSLSRSSRSWRTRS